MVLDFIALKMVERREIAERAKDNPAWQLMSMFL